MAINKGLVHLTPAICTEEAEKAIMEWLEGGGLAQECHHLQVALSVLSKIQLVNPSPYSKIAAKMGKLTSDRVLQIVRLIEGAPQRLNPVSSEVPRENFRPKTYARFYTAVISLFHGAFGTNGVGELIDKRSMNSAADKILEMLNIRDIDSEVKNLIASVAADAALSIVSRYRNGSTLDYIAATYEPWGNMQTVLGKNDRPPEGVSYANSAFQGMQVSMSKSARGLGSNP